MSRPHGCGRLFPVARAKQRLGQPPLAASHRVHMAVGEGLNRGLPGLGVGASLEPGPLGFCLGMTTPQVHVMGQTDPVCLLHDSADSLQQPPTDRRGVVQRRAITSRTEPGRRVPPRP